MITRRTLLIFNFGVAGLFLLIGVLSMYAMSLLHPNASRLEVPPVFSSSVLTTIAEEGDVAKLRSTAIFYYELARDMRKARHAESEGYLNDAQIVFFFVAGLFLIGGLLVLAPPKREEPPA